MVGVRVKLDKAKLVVGARVSLDMTTLTIMRILPREVDPVVFHMLNEGIIFFIFNNKKKILERSPSLTLVD